MCIADVLDTWRHQRALLGAVSDLVDADLHTAAVAHRHQRRRGRLCAPAGVAGGGRAQPPGAGTTRPIQAPSLELQSRLR